jgi:osmotically-inducible protein OsmY
MVRAAPKTSGKLAYPYGRVSSDEEVLAAVLNALHHSSGVPQERLRVSVRRGHAVLSGVVQQEFERSLAEQAAKSAPGVVEITNEITLES